MSESRRLSLACVLALVSAFLVTAAGASAQAALTAAISQVNSTRFPTVVSHVTLVDGSGRPVLGLGPTNWELLEDGKPVAKVEVGTAVNLQEHLLVLLAIDTSGSMQGRALEDAKAAASTFVQGLGQQDKAAIVSFAATPLLAQQFTENKEALARALRDLKAVGDTALYDALTLAAEAMAQQSGGRRIVILLSDGEDTASKAKLAEALQAVQAAGAPVFTVGLGAQVDRNVLNTVASSTGGVALYAPSSADLQTAYKNIADQLRNQYVLTFTSALPADGQRHTLLVRARVGGATAEAQAGFIATWVPPQITILAPTAGQTVKGKVRVEVKVEGQSKTAKVEAVAAGRVVGVATSEPYVIEWDTSTLAAGSHTLDVVAYDVWGNRATKQVSVVVEAQPTPTPVLLPTRTPAPTPTPAAAGGSFDGLLLGGLGFFAFAALALVVVRRARRPKAASAWREMRRDLPISSCPTCGQPLKRGQECPACQAKGEELIRRRLSELAGEANASEPPEEGKR